MLFPSELRHPRQLLSLSGQEDLPNNPLTPLLAVGSLHWRINRAVSLTANEKLKKKQIFTSTKCQMCKWLCFHFYFIDGQEKLDSALELAEIQSV